MPYLCLCYYDTGAMAGLDAAELQAIGAACRPRDEAPVHYADGPTTTGKVRHISNICSFFLDEPAYDAEWKREMSS